MKKVLRYEDNEQYWDRRWTEAGSDPNHFTDLNIYPIKYAEMVVGDPGERILEIGTGLGRIMKHYHYQGHDISGIERSEVAVGQMLEEDPELKIQAADVSNLPYADASFDAVMAFGVYHNLEHDMQRALHETARCLKDGGRFCISMRPNNVEMLLNEVYWNRKIRSNRRSKRQFHKWLVGESEFRRTLQGYGLATTAMYRARNVSILYRAAWLRARSNNETDRRGGGYQLNGLGRALDGCLTRVMPGQFCNVLVFVGHKKSKQNQQRKAA